MKNLCAFLLTLLVINFVISQELRSQEVFKSYPFPIVDHSTHKFGNSMAIDGNYAVIGEQGYDNDKGRVFVLCFNGINWNTIAILKASDGKESDNFGHSVDISGNTIIIGASGKDNVLSNCGQAYIFDKPASGWINMTETAILKASNLIENNYFGESVGISGNAIVVGVNSIDHGAAYVYEKPFTGWTNTIETAILTPSINSYNDYFGRSVSIDNKTIVVGGVYNSKSSAFVFEKPTGGWISMSETAELTVLGGGLDYVFGKSIDISGNTIVVGAPEKNGCNIRGNVYVYEKPEIGWTNMTETAKVASGSIGVSFGCSVSISNNTILVGTSFGYDTFYGYFGSAYVYEKPATGWAPVEKSVRFEHKILNFGNFVAISNDKVLIGSIEENSFSGAVYSYIKPATGWKTAEYTLPPSQKIIDTTLECLNYKYGQAVAIDGNYAVVSTPGYYSKVGIAYVLHRSKINTWDTVASLKTSDERVICFGEKSVCISGKTIVVGANCGDNETSYNSGAAYIYEMPDEGWSTMTETAKLYPSKGGFDDNFGAAVSISGNTVAVGAYRTGAYNAAKGTVYVFEKPVGGWKNTTETAKLRSEDLSNNDNFGYSVGISENVIVVGALGDDDNGSSSGSAYVFEKPVYGWSEMTETAKLTASDGFAGDIFGSSVSIYENTIVIGAPGDNNSRKPAGSVYVFEKPASHWMDMTETIKINAFDGDSLDKFGKTVGITDDVIIVGAFQDDNKGSAYVYEKLNSGWNETLATTKIMAFDGNNLDNFGYSVGISGNKAIVGANGDESGFGLNSGSAYIYVFDQLDKPYIQCLEDITVQTNNGTKHIVSGNEFDILSAGDNVTLTDTAYQLTGATIKEMTHSRSLAGLEFNMGVTTVIWTVYDNNGKSTSARFDVNVIDIEKPTITCAGDLIIPTDPGECRHSNLSKTLDPVNISDNYGIMSLTNSFNSDSTLYRSYFEKGTTTIFWTVTDSAGNINSCTHNIIVVDNTIPEIICKGDTTVYTPIGIKYKAFFKEFDPKKFHDNCLIDYCTCALSGATVLNTTKIWSIGGVEFNPGKTNVIWTVYDKSGNSVSCNFNITVNEVEGYNFSCMDSEQFKTLPIPYVNKENCYFGYSVDVDSNIAVVGEYGNDVNTGRAVVLYFNGLEWEELAVLTASDQKYRKFFGKSVSISGDCIIIGAPGYGNIVGSAYVFEKPASGWADMTETAILTASDGAEDDFFGCSVGITQNTIVIGSYLDDDNASNSGSAYVYIKPDGGWLDTSETAKLRASDASENDYFGYSVGISQSTIIVGAYQDDNGTTYSGSAYVFERPAGGWANMAETAKLTASNKQYGDNFGNSVDISQNTILVGAYHANEGIKLAGSAYVFEKPEGGWVNMTETARLTASDRSFADFFGISVSISNKCIVVGAYQDDDNGNASGSAYVFEKPEGGWVNMNEDAKLTASDGEVVDFLGYAVGVSGENILLGAYGDDDYGNSGGSVYAYKKNDKYWKDTIEFQKVYTKIIKNNINNKYGNVVAIDSNFAVIGSPGFLDNTGLAYVLYKNGNIWQTIANLKASDGRKNDYFGSAVSISGSCIVIGAYGNQENGYLSGSAYVFEKPIGGWANMTETAKLTSSDGAEYDRFGSSVDIFMDEILVGAYMDENIGSAYIFKKPISGWKSSTEIAKLTSSDASLYDYFGSSVKISKDFVVVGAFLDDDKADGSGAAYVFDKPSGGWVNMTEKAKLQPKVGRLIAYFGSSIDISGDYVVIGTVNENAAYLFKRPKNGWIDTVEIAKFKTSVITGSSFGRSVSIFNNYIVIGASHYNTYGKFSGSAYIFKKPESEWTDATEYLTLTTSDISVNDYFGVSVDISDKYILIGAEGNDDFGEESGSAYFYEIIDDDPVIYCNSNITVKTFKDSSYVASNGEFDLISAEDDCQIVKIKCNLNGATMMADTSISSLEGIKFFAGETLVTWKVFDANGNNSDCSFTITVEEVDGPILSCIENQIRTIVTAAVYIADSNEFDVKEVNSSTTLTDTTYQLSRATTQPEISKGSLDGVVFNIGTTTVTWTFYDINGDKNSCSFDVIIVDSVKPIIYGEIDTTIISGCSISDTIPAAKTIAEIEALDGSPQILGNIADGLLTVSHVDRIENQTPLVLIRTYIISDLAGNESTIDHIIIVDDNIAPDIQGTIAPLYILGCSLNDTIIAETSVAGLEALAGNPTISDNCKSDSLLLVSHNDIIINLDPIIVARTYSIKDIRGNNASLGQLIYIHDSIPPAFTCTEDKSVESNSKYQYLNEGTIWDANVTDNCTPLLDISIFYSATGATTFNGLKTLDSATFNLGQTHVFITAQDNEDNIASCSFDVQVEYKVAPNIICAENNIKFTNAGSCDYSNSIAELDPIIDLDTSIFSSLINDYNFNNTLHGVTFSLGTTNVHWTITDIFGNYSTCTQKIDVIDLEVPIINCIPDQYREIKSSDDTYLSISKEFDPLYANDNCSEVNIYNSINNSQTLEGEVFPIGITTVNWIATDHSGNSASCSFIVEIIKSETQISNIRDNDAINIYPNPVIGKLIVNSQNRQIEKLQVIDIIGNIIIDKVIFSDKAVIDLSNLSGGCYVLQIIIDGELISKKIIKSKLNK